MDLELEDLKQFYGTTQYFDVYGFNVTDGVKYIIDNGYWWFVSDLLIVVNMKPEIKKEEFLCLKLKLNGEKAKAIITDGNDKTLYEQKYNYTNVKKELKLFLTNNVLMLASEY